MRSGFLQKGKGSVAITPLSPYFFNYEEVNILKL
jgi:hypothetical protein